MPGQHVLSSAPPLRSARRRRSFADFFGLYRQRRALERLDDAALRDLGLTRTEVDAEASRPIWDVPVGWLR